MTVNKYTFFPGTEIPGSKRFNATVKKPAADATQQAQTSSVPMTTAPQTTVPTATAPITKVPTTPAPSVAPSFQAVMDGLSAPKMPEKDLSGVASTVKKAQESGDLEKLKETAQDMEAMFVNLMFKSMRSTVDTSGLIDKSYGREVFEDMYYEETSKNLAKGKGKGLGLADMIYKDLVKMYNQSKG